MRRFIVLSAATLALLVGVSISTLLPSRDAAAQSSGAHIVAVDLDIAPGQMAAFMDAIKENGAASVKEPGCRVFNISVSANDPNHVFLYEVYDNEAAANAHRATDHFKKYQAAAAKIVTGRNVRVLTGIAFNSKAQ